VVADCVIMRNNDCCYGLWVWRRRCLVGSEYEIKIYLSFIGFFFIDF